MVEITNLAEVVIVNSDLRKLLLLRRSQSDKRRPNQWDLPGGHIEKNESNEEGAIRESLEESGLVIKNPQLFTCASLEVENDNRLINWLFFTANSKQSEIKLSYEHDSYRWVLLDEALTLVTYERQLVPLKMIKRYELCPSLVT